MIPPQRHFREEGERILERSVWRLPRNPGGSGEINSVNHDFEVSGPEIVPDPHDSHRARQATLGRAGRQDAAECRRRGHKGGCYLGRGQRSKFLDPRSATARSNTAGSSARLCRYFS